MRVQNGGDRESVYQLSTTWWMIPPSSLHPRCLPTSYHPLASAARRAAAPTSPTTAYLDRIKFQNILKYVLVKYQLDSKCMVHYICSYYFILKVLQIIPRGTIEKSQPHQLQACVFQQELVVDVVSTYVESASLELLRSSAGAPRYWRQLAG